MLNYMLLSNVSSIYLVITLTSQGFRQVKCLLQNPLFAFSHCMLIFRINVSNVFQRYVSSVGISNFLTTIANLSLFNLVYFIIFRCEYQVLSACVASVRRRMEGIDYYVAEGGRAFQDIEEILSDMMGCDDEM